jgi:hypothetical protein
MNALPSEGSRNWNKLEAVTLHESNKWVVFLRKQTSDGNETGAAVSAEEGVNVYYPEKMNIAGHFDQSG